MNIGKYIKWARKQRATFPVCMHVLRDKCKACKTKGGRERLDKFATMLYINRRFLPSC